MLSKEEIVNIAALARIGLHDADIELYQKDLSAVLDYFKELEELDTTNVQPIGHITGMTDRVRSDEADDFGTVGKEAILKNTPETKDGYIKVKSVL